MKQQFDLSPLGSPQIPHNVHMRPRRFSVSVSKKLRNAPLPSFLLGAIGLEAIC